MTASSQRRPDPGEPSRDSERIEPHRIPDSGDVSENPSGGGLVREFADEWKSGKWLSVEEFLDAHRQAAADSETAVQLIYEEFCLRQEEGEVVDPAEIVERFPQYESQLRLVLDCDNVLRSIDRDPVFPVAGEQLGEFRLLDELGRGAEGRVFLATQPSLSDRPVVLKIGPCKGHEHLSLARLQHAAIVPLYLAHDDSQRDLRLLCMPYLGGCSLSRIMEAICRVPVDQRSGQDFVDALRQARAASPIKISMKGPALQFLSRASYVQAVCWIGACLADALHYSHERGLAHLDVKPPNVLLAGDGQPMLLDFHLAHEISDAAESAIGGIGGTPGYMSPEQQAAMAAIEAGVPIPTAIDGRSDLYSLGLVLHELLELPRPDAGKRCEEGPRSARGLSIPPRLARVLRKCTARHPDERYSDAGTLSLALRSCLVEDSGEQAVSRYGVAVQWFGRMQRRGALLAMAALLLVVAVGFFGWKHFLRAGSGRAAVVGVSQSKDDVRSSPRRTAADDLHSLVEQLQFIDGLELLPAKNLQKLEEGCREVWRRRAQFSNPGDSATDDNGRRIRTDLLDLAILFADLHVRIAPAELRATAQRESLDILKQAESELGDNVVLSAERKNYAAEAGTEEEAGRGTALGVTDGPGTEWEHFALGRSQYRAGKYEAAAEMFQHAVDISPHSFWPNFYRGICAYRLRQYEVALASFSASVAIAPRNAECIYNRGLAYRALGCEDAAKRDLERARCLKPELCIPPAAGIALETDSHFKGAQSGR